MRKLVLMMSVSIDGFVAGPHAHAGGLPEPDELKRWKLDRVRQAGTHIMGRVTYEEMAAHWPTSADDYAAPMNEIRKVVFSKTLGEVTWAESSIARGDLEEEIATLRRQPGGEIIAWGGASLAQSLFVGRTYRRIRSRHSSRRVRERPADVPGPARRAATRTARGAKIRYRHRPPRLRAERSSRPAPRMSANRPRLGCTQSGAFGRGAEFSDGGYAHVRRSRRHGLSAAYEWYVRLFG